MVTKSLRQKVITGSVWTILGQFSSLFLSLISNVWLARLLSPTEFGQLGILMFFISTANILTEGGLGGAIIRKPNATKEDYSTIFIFNVIVSCICFVLLVLFSRQIVLFYDDITLQKPLITLGLVLIINSLQLVQTTHLMADLRYKTKSIYDFISTLLSSILGLILAYKGFGLWSLIVMQLSNSIFKTILLWSFEKFYFKLVFNKNSFRELFGFGINTTLTTILNITFNDIYQVVIGKIFTIGQVGFYYQAKKINDVFSSVFISLSQGPVFSALSKIQNDKKVFLNSFKTIITILISFLGFLTILLFYYSDSIISFVLGKQWIESAVYLRFLSIAAFFYIQENFNRVIFKVYNKTKTLLYIEIFKKTIQMLTVLVGIYFSDINILLFGFIFSNLLGYIINYFFSKKIIYYKDKSELKITFTIFFITISFLIVLYLMEFLFKDLHQYKLVLLILIFPCYFYILKKQNIFNFCLLYKQRIKD